MKKSLASRIVYQQGILQIFIRFVIFLTEIVAETWNTDVDSSTQDTGNQHDDAGSNSVIRNVVFINSLFVLFLSLLSKVENLLIATILSSFRATITDKGSLIEQRARKVITCRLSDLSVSFDFFGNSSFVFQNGLSDSFEGFPAL